MDELKTPAEKGVVYIVATPIGNLDDITFRAVDILKSVDFIAAEDTRHTARLLARFNIKSQLLSCHEHNEAIRAVQIAERLKAGASAAVVSNAGTPGVSDPGYRIIKEAIARDIRVVPVPGASAAVAAMSASGMPSDRFCFAGFVPKTINKRNAFLNELAKKKETLVLYESPRRLISLLKAVLQHMGDRYVVVARELTKIHEEFLRGSVAGVIKELEKRDSIKGEVTLLIEGCFEDATCEPEMLENEIRHLVLENNPPTSRLAAELAKRYNLSKNEIYQEILRIKSLCPAEPGKHKNGDFTDG